MLYLKNIFIGTTFRSLITLLLLAGVLISSGCVEVEQLSPVVKTRDPVRKHYRKLRNYHLTLDLLTSRRRFYAGEDVTFRYRLTNRGRKPLRLNEWYMNDPDNIRIYYRPYTPQLKVFNSAQWTLLEPHYKKPIRHFELELYPNNMVFIDKKIPFIKAAGADNPTVKRGRYYVIAELTLTSVNVRSKPAIIDIP